MRLIFVICLDFEYAYNQEKEGVEVNIERINDGFVQYYDNKVIEKIAFTGYSVSENPNAEPIIISLGDGIEIDLSKDKFIGTCTVHFHNKPPKEFDNIDFSIVHNSSYGVPISEDGSKMFVGRWEWNKGLQAYDTETGVLLWRLKQGRIRNIFVRSDYLVVAKANAAVFKVSIDSGKILGQIKGIGIEGIYNLDSPYILADVPVGKMLAIDTDKMAIVKKYGNKVVNPLNCLGIVICDVALKDNVLSISGEDQCPKNGAPFKDRVIDSDFYKGLR